MKKIENDSMKTVNCLSNDLDMIYHRAARKMGITDSVLVVLYMIYEKGDGCLLYDICVGSGLSKQTINSAVRKLEKDEMLFLKQDKGNKKRVFLTEKGKEYMTATAARLYEAECKAFDDWEKEELDTYLRLMKKYIDSLRIQIEKMEG